jgi:hypothetical protein
MRHFRGPYLSTRPAFLLAACLPYDGLAQSPEKLAGSPREEVWMCFLKY